MGNVPPSAFRRPPPPGRRLLIDSNKVAAPTTSKSEGDTSRVRSRPFYFRNCKKATPSNSIIESLPDELLMEILLRLSADEIYDNARLVCRRLFHLIHSDAFVREHLHRASSGLLLWPPSDVHDHDCNSPILVTATAQGRVDTSELSCRVTFLVICSCNGLALCLREDESRERIPFIFNPATKSVFDLPSFPDRGEQLHGRLSMAYSAASMAYKVVGSVYRSYFLILTVGVDNSWRRVEVDGIEGFPSKASWVLLSSPLMTGGFVHWASGAYVASLNVDTEIFTVTPTPPLMFLSDYEETYYNYMSTGEYLSLFIPCGDWSWEVWEMKPETREWRKVPPNIDLEAHKSKIQQFALLGDYDSVQPFGWVRYPDVLAFWRPFSDSGRGRSFIIYNLGTEEFEYIEFSANHSYCHAVQHRNSLVWSEQS